MATTNKSLNLPAYDSANWDVPLNENFTWIDAALGSSLNIPVAGVPAPPVVLTASQLRNASIVFSGLLGNNVNYQVPASVGCGLTIYNTTTGAFTLTISSGGAGSSVVIPQNQSRAVLSDGTNIKLEDVYGTANQVLFNTGTNIDGATGFTFGSDILTTPRIRTGDGTTALPAISATTATTTGLSFPVVNELAISTNALERARFNAAGAIALGTATDYGDAGEVIKSAGNAAPVTWGLSGAVSIASLPYSGSSVVFSGLTLTSYKFVVLVFSAVINSSGGGRSIILDGVTLKTISTGSTVYGMATIHLLSGVGTSAIGGVAGGATETYGFGTSITTASTTITISSPGGLSGGNVYLLGMA